MHKFIHRDGFDLKYSIYGQETCAIVIGSSIYYPRTFSNDIYKNLKMVFMDHRGFAACSRKTNASDFQLNKMLEDIESLRIELNIGKVIIIGHSIHSFIALEYAKRYPQHVSHLVLIAGSPIIGDRLHHEANRYFAESVCPERKTLLASNMAGIEERLIDGVAKIGFVERILAFAPMIWYNPRYDATALWNGVELDEVGAQVIWGSMFEDYEVSANTEFVTCPVFLALGRYDYWNPPHLWEGARHKFQNLTVRVFEHSAHTPQLEEPKLFDNELITWLNSTNS